MVSINEVSEKLELEYPCSWNYKVLSSDEVTIKESIIEVIGEKVHTLTFSNKSSSGKYVSMNLELIVNSEDERNFIYESLKSHKLIKMVL